MGNCDKMYDSDLYEGLSPPMYLTCNMYIFTALFNKLQ